jgi:hypothetical protein
MNEKELGHSEKTHQGSSGALCPSPPTPASPGATAPRFAHARACGNKMKPAVSLGHAGTRKSPGGVQGTMPGTGILCLRRRALSQVFSCFLFVRAHIPPSPSHATPSCLACWWSPPLLLPAALALSHPPKSMASAPMLPQPSAMAPSSLPSPSARFVFLSLGYP